MNQKRKDGIATTTATTTTPISSSTSPSPAGKPKKKRANNNNNSSKTLKNQQQAKKSPNSFFLPKGHNTITATATKRTRPYEIIYFRYAFEDCLGYEYEKLPFFDQTAMQALGGNPFKEFLRIKLENYHQDDQED